MEGITKLATAIQPKTVEGVEQDKHERIRNHRKRNAKLSLEDAWKQFALKRIQDGEDEAFRYILQNTIINGLIKRISNSFYKAWKNNSRVSLHDFQSVAYEKAWNIIANYSPHYQQWFLYEQLSNGIDQACKMLLRTEGLTKDRKTHKNTAYHKSLNLYADFLADSASSLESNLLLRESLQEAISTFNHDEIGVYNLFINSDNIEWITLDDICNLLNLNHRQQAKRILDSMKYKISQHTAP